MINHHHQSSPSWIIIIIIIIIINPIFRQKCAPTTLGTLLKFVLCPTEKHRAWQFYQLSVPYIPETRSYTSVKSITDR